MNKKLRHKYSGEVKFSEVDSFGVVHNLSYLYWLEWARTEFLFDIGLPKDDSLFSIRYPLMTVNSIINYYNPIKFTDIYTVYTGVKNIGRSSLTFENEIYSKDEKILGAQTTLVYVDRQTNKSLELPKELIERIKKYEQGI